MATQRELETKVVIITGGAEGVGLGMATRLAKHGARIVIASRNADVGEQAVRVITSGAGIEPDQVAWVETDITREIDTENMVRFAVERYGRLDAAINNAAKHHVGRFGDTERDAGEAAAFLISDRSTFITGTTLFVDGGMCL